MAKFVDEELYYSPLEASQRLRVSSKTLQRWAETGSVSVWEGTSGNRKKNKKQMTIKVHQTPTGYRYYSQASIDQLSDQLKNKLNNEG